MAKRTMSLAPDDAITISQTTRAMLLVGGFMTLLGVWFTFQALSVASALGLKTMWKLWTPVLMFLPPAVFLGFGVPTLIAALKFRAVAERGDVTALTSGLGALAIAYVAQATVMLIVVALGLFGALGPALR